jgi:hypothetical protein
MEKIIIEATSSSPRVVLDPDNLIFEISGESRPKNVPEFYQPILQWLDEFGEALKTKQDTTDLFEFNFKFEYFNSLSGKFILDLCKKLNRLHADGNNITVKWHYEEDDDDMHEVGKEMSRISKLPFDYVEVKI